MDIFLGVLFLIVCILLIAVILLQRGRGGGLGSAFGGGAGSSAFGTRTGDVFTWVTIVLTAAFLLLAVGTVIAHKQEPDQVATPEFSPAPGPIDEPVNVTISSETRGAEIWYTVDGGEPKQNESMPYEKNPVPIEPGMTLRAKAYRPGWQDSEVAVGAYLEPVPPETPETEEPEAPAVDAEDDEQSQTAPAGESETKNTEEPTTRPVEEATTQPVGS
ncbi:MAG: preprotein translocase subunit SecG [Phycisphaerae bacterium]